MIALTHMDRHTMYLNPDHIISIEETPDTVISLFNGNRYIVLEPAAVIINRIITFRAVIIRRAEGHPSIKYLHRKRSGFYKRALIDAKTVCSDPDEIPDQTPLHSRGY